MTRKHSQHGIHSPQGPTGHFLRKRDRPDPVPGSLERGFPGAPAYSSLLFAFHPSIRHFLPLSRELLALSVHQIMQIPAVLMRGADGALTLWQPCTWHAAPPPTILLPWDEEVSNRGVCRQTSHRPWAHSAPGTALRSDYKIQLTFSPGYSSSSPTPHFPSSQQYTEISQIMTKYSRYSDKWPTSAIQCRKRHLNM